MKISSMTCPHCRAAYEIAESTSAVGAAGRFDCGVCGTPLAVWDEPKLRAFRLEVPPEHKYPRVPTPPCFA
ncbi:MJ0042-type zinc finger domain-containing protein [Bradyrhizobium oligotrophicum]|uniref:MJ0042-type zinc finger domain-containing protein n=1 Tax=Bradyrhizobium oligotrophicum TaxID=44255 RepID=UPI000347B547|nr:MJ0042-type zinc finger domain-containing protein [Bradyrhizobium oligotrophicum]